MRDAGTVLKVLDKLADTPGGGSNTKIRPARNRLEGSYNHIFKSTHTLLYILLSKRQRKTETYKTFFLPKIIYLLHYVSQNFIKLRSTSIVYPGVDLHGQEQPEVGVGGQAVELFLQGHQPVGGQVDILQHDPAT